MPLLIEGARQLGFELTERQLQQFQLYFETLVDWNTRMNLTAITDLEGVQVRHFLDSLTVGSALLNELGSVPPEGYRLADIGTGAGFPGVPLKILWPQIMLTLADSTGKKTTFLKELCVILGLEGVEIHTARAEDLGQDRRHRERYGAVTARAVASLPVLCEYCLPLVKIGGHFFAPKKGNISHELETARTASRILGGTSPRRHTFILPGENEERVVVAIKKVRATPSSYPRRVGVAKSMPLGLKASDRGTAS